MSQEPTVDRTPVAQWARGVGERVDSAPAWATFLLVLLPLLVVYLPSAEREQQNVDAIAAALPAWSLVEDGDLTLEEFADLPLRWLVEGEDGLVSNRSPGIIAVGVPFYFVAHAPLGPDDRLPSLVPAAVASAVVAALAMGVLHLVFRRLVSASTAVVAALVAGLATATWGISADALWPHGPVQFWMALSLLLAAGGRYLASGLSMGAAVLTRPVAAVAAALLGTSLSVLERSWKPVVRIGLGALVGALLLCVYNELVFGEFSPVTDAYGSAFVDAASERSPGWYVRNVVGMLVGIDNGMLVWSPFLWFLLPGIVPAWREAPSWVRAGAVSGAVYMLVHLWLNRQSGGLLHNYRYPLEMLTFAAPLLLLSWRAFVARGSLLLRGCFAAAVVLSIALQANVAWEHVESLFLEV